MEPGRFRESRRVAGAAAAPLLDLDPDLGALLSPDRYELARSELRVGVQALPGGEWKTGRLVDADPIHVGLLALEGVIAREVVVAETVSLELLGPGDVVRPWKIGEEVALVNLSVRWMVLAPVRLAILDRRFAAQLARFPEVNAALIDRLNQRASRLASTQAISQLHRVDRRLRALFWHLAERWGRVTPDGILVPLGLPHRVIAQLVGARRPTVSTALGELARSGEIRRRDDGTWLLTGEALSGAPRSARIVRHRRPVLPAGSPAPGALGPDRDAGRAPHPDPGLSEELPVLDPERVAAVRAAVQDVLGRAAEQGETLQAICEQAEVLRRRTRALRAGRVLARSAPAQESSG